MATKAAKPASTQAHLPLAGVEDGIIILRDGSYRAVLSVGSTNFLLKSEAEQNAVVGAYQNFLNSLNYSIQIVMQSRHLDLEMYLKTLEERIIEQRNELIRQQTSDYVKYVRELISVANIMDKHFYVVVPYTPLTAAKKSLLGSLIPSSKLSQLKINEAEFATHKEEIVQRAQIVASGLSSLGLRTEMLDTNSIIRLLYTVYNYEIASEQRLEKPEDLSGPLVSVQTEDADGESALTGKGPVDTEKADIEPQVDSNTLPPEPKIMQPVAAASETILNAADQTTTPEPPLEAN